MTQRTVSGKVLKNKTFEIALNLQYDRYQRGLASKVYKCFYKKTGLEATGKARANINKVQEMQMNN